MASRWLFMDALLPVTKKMTARLLCNTVTAIISHRVTSEGRVLVLLLVLTVTATGCRVPVFSFRTALLHSWPLPMVVRPVLSIGQMTTTAPLSVKKPLWRGPLISRSSIPTVCLNLLLGSTRPFNRSLSYIGGRVQDKGHCCQTVDKMPFASTERTPFTVRGVVFVIVSTHTVRGGQKELTYRWYTT